MSNTVRRVGSKVSIDDPKHPGIWIVRSTGPVNAVLEPVVGGRRLRVPLSMLTDPTDAPAPLVPSVFYHPGELVRIAAGKWAGVWVVIADRASDKVNLAKLGGDEGRYLRAARRGLIKVNPADVLKEA